MRSKLSLALLLAAACGNDRPPSTSTPAPIVGATPAVITTGAPSARAWDLNDVSMLLPFPAADDMPRLLQTSSRGAMGELIPKAWLDTVPKPFVVNIEHAPSLAPLRVIAIRIDPCFKATPSAPCRTMVRMSWQPFVDHAGTFSAIDGALHTFYDL